MKVVGDPRRLPICGGPVGLGSLLVQKKKNFTKKNRDGNDGKSGENSKN